MRDSSLEYVKSLGSPDQDFRTEDGLLLVYLPAWVRLHTTLVAQASEASTFLGFWSPPETMLAQLAFESFAFVYAATNLLAVLVLAGLRDGAFFKRPSKEAIKEMQDGTLSALHWFP